MNWRYSGFDTLWGILGGATIAAIVIYQSTAIAAKNPQEIAQIAKTVTVQVNPPGGTGESGSGVIIAKQGNVYTVLTCNHVGEIDPKINVRTYDGKDYPVVVQSLGNLNNENEPDLALLTFSSSAEYPVATLGNSEQTTEGSQIFVFGYPATGGVSGINRNFEFSPGFITSRPNNRNYGYNMRYSAVTLGGMSGGPVFDIDGRVIGIHGLGDRDPARGRVQTENGGQESSVALQVKTGFNSAIPINTFLALRSQINNSSASVTIDNSASTDRPAERLSNPQTATDYSARGSTRQEQGNKQGAVEDFNRSISLNSNDGITYFNRGVARYEQGDIAGALSDFSQAITLNPQNLMAYYNRGTIRHSHSDYRGAKEDFDQVIRLSASDFTAYYNRAVARAAMGDRQGAIADFGEVLRLNPSFTTAYNNRAIVRRLQGDKQGAIQDFSEVLRFDPNNAIAYYNRGLVRRDVGDVQGAIADLQTAANLFQQQGNTTNYQKTLEKIQRIQSKPAQQPVVPDGTGVEQPQPAEDTGF